MSWFNWQGRLLPYAMRYALLKSGFLDADTANDLANFDIALGSKRSTIELRNVGINTERVAELARLPAGLQLKTARITVLRLSFVRDGYQANIEIQVEGIEVIVELLDEISADDSKPEPRPRSTSPASTRTPLHRKTNRRIRTPSQYDPGGTKERDRDPHIPTTQEMAQSFLLHENPRERQEMEASMVANLRSMDDSYMSENSEIADVGTGVAGGLPDFLSGILKGVMDRAKYNIRDVQVRVQANIGTSLADLDPVELKLQIAQIEGTSFLEPSLTVAGLAIDLVTSESIMPDPILSVPTSPATSRASVSRSSTPDRASAQMSDLHASQQLSQASTNQYHDQEQNQRSITPVGFAPVSPDMRRSPAYEESALAQSMQSETVFTASGHFADGGDESVLHTRTAEPAKPIAHSVATLDEDRFADALEDDPAPQIAESVYGIMPGDDNLSWASRRNLHTIPADDLWRSMLSDADSTQSLALDEDVQHDVAGVRGSSDHFVDEGSASTDPKIATTPRTDGNLRSWPILERSTHPISWERTGTWPLCKQEVVDTEDDKIPPVSNLQSPVPDEIFEDAAPSPVPSPEEELASSADSPEYADMAESRVYTHEEAESMYLSAVMDTSFSEMPGGWTASVSDKMTDLSAPQDVLDIQTPIETDPGILRGREAVERPVLDSGVATPRPTTPLRDPAAQNPPEHMSQTRTRRLLHVDNVSVSSRTTNASGTESSKAEPSKARPDTGFSSTRQNRNMPGAFSVYSDLSRSRANMASSIFATADVPSARVEDEQDFMTGGPELSVEISDVIVHADVFTSRALYAIITRIDLRTPQKTSDEALPSSTSGSSAPASILPIIKLHIRHIEVTFFDQIPIVEYIDSASGHDDSGITSLLCDGLDFRHEDDMILQLGSIQVLLGGKPLLSLEHDLGNMSSSRMFHEHSSVFRVVVSSNQVSATGQGITNIMLETASIHIHLNLATIDDILAPYGGMSGMMELGGSFMAESGASSPTTIRPNKGVRFAGEAPPEVVSKTEIKVNGRVDGASITLSTPACSLHLRTTALKFVHRHFGTSLSLNQVVLAGPYQGSVAEAPICVDILNLRLEYLVTPQDKDLERLLSLLTPSKDKYDNDDDILIDTLLRQRRKGAVLKVLIQNVNARVDSWDAIPALTNFGEELSKLSAVTKYLPEDERPGMLALLCVKSGDAKIPLNETFGAMMIKFGNVHLAHVGLPALLALSVGTLALSQQSGLQVLHPLIPSPTSDSLPVIMARMLGDEEQPTLKIKLYNLCIEYSVPLLLLLTSKQDMQDADDALTELAQSVAGLVLGEKPTSSLPRSTSQVSAAAAPKKIMLEVLIHDTAFGLSPSTLSSKAMFVLSDVRFLLRVPPGVAVDAKLEVRRAAFYLRDQPSYRDNTLHVANVPEVARFLATEDFISVGSIMSADIAVHAEQGVHPDENQAVEVDAKIELLLLETCADSTATLFATLGNLAPPSIASDEPKYLTEPMTIEDMMASFTGEPVVESSTVPETLFDIDDDISADADMLSSVASFDADTQELFEESEMTESLYGPVSGLLDTNDFDLPAQQDIQAEYSETVASLLEEDPFEIAEIPQTLMDNAALLRELDKQSSRPAHTGAVDLPEAEYEDLGLEALHAGPQILGSKDAFASPHAGRRPTRPAKLKSSNPFQLRLRDSHLIWHLHDGYDWQRTRDGIIKKVEEVEQKIDERKAKRRQSHHDPEDDESVIGDFLFNSIYIGVGAEHEAQDLRRAINKAIDDGRSETESVAVSGTSRPTTYSATGNVHHGSRRRRLKLGRSGSHKIAFELRGVGADIVVYPPGESETMNSVNLRIKDFEIFDQVPSSSWRKFLTSADNSVQRREMAKPMFDIEVLTLKTLQSHAASELALRVVALPIRLHVDQDALEFINRFFDFKDPQLASDKPPSEEPFIQRLEVETVDLCLDYKPKQMNYVGLRSGHTAELKNLVTLEGANIRLKHVIIYGLRGFDKIHPTLNDIWVQDVVRNQLPTVIAGVAAMRSLVNIGTGIRDVVAIPVREYRKDGRVVRSIQKGAYQFGKTTASELARLGAKVALGTQTVLSSAEQYLSPSSTIPPRISTSRRVSNEHGWHDLPSEDDEPEQRAVSAYANQPLGVLAGLKTARRQLEHDLLTARDALIAVQGEVLDSAGPGGAAAAVVRHAPTVLLRPVIGATRAVGTALLGVGNQIDRSNVRKNEDKYKPR